MLPTTRAWLVSSLLLLVVAALLHAAVLLGASGAWAALVHLTLFGWVSGMIVAVNYHTMPVFTARDFPSRALIWAHLAVFVAGVLVAAAALLAGARGPLVVGLALELAAALLFALNIGLLLARGVRRGLPPAPPPVPGQRAVDRLGTRATSVSGLALPLALALMLGGRVGVLVGAWWLAAEHLAALGWVMLMIVGVAYHVLPRFSGRATRGAAWAGAQLGLHLAALLMVVAGLGLGMGGLFAAGGLAMSAALALFAWTVWPTLRAVRPRSALIQPTVKEPAR
ncbi:MAG TPA: hypothetical protein PKD53_21380 [Chloroflexaceae bacterium]|nr:hypothetical protein [Chloroflexaceae bacterium]